MKKPIKPYRGKRADRPVHEMLIRIGLPVGAAALIASFFARGMSFLVALFALFSFFLAFCGALWTPWRNKRLRIIANVLKVITAVLVLVVIISFVAVEIKIFSYGDGSPDPDADAVIILGAGLFEDRPSLVLQSRLDLALDYLKGNPGCAVIVSGGQGPGETITEALAMERYLTGRGVSAERIYQEDRSSNTLENLACSMELMAELGLSADSVVIISNSFHLYRAETLAADLGLTVTTLGAPVPKVWLTPLNSYVREYFSIVKMFFQRLN